MSLPWVVTCTGCGCVVTCFAIDPQDEHMQVQADAPPRTSAHVACSCCWGTYRYTRKQIGRGEPTPNPRCSKQRGKESKTDGALLVAASVVAVIRLRGQEIKPSPKLTATIKDSIELARLVLAELQR